jgi:hypothetical protein
MEDKRPQDENSESLEEEDKDIVPEFSAEYKRDM